MTKITEARTKQQIIDGLLLKAGWDVNNASQVTSELSIWIGLPDRIKKPQHRTPRFSIC